MQKALLGLLIGSLLANSIEAFKTKQYYHAAWYTVYFILTAIVLLLDIFSS